MNLKNVYLSTLVPEFPRIVNYNNQEIKRYLDIIYDETRGVVIVPINTPGRVKGSTGEFVTVVTDNLIVKNQYTNLFDNITTADYSWYTTYIGKDASIRDASTWENPNYKYIDVNKPYYKVNNDDPLTGGNIALRAETVSQVVELLFDASAANDFSILLDPCSGATYDITAADSSVQWISFICVDYDASWGSTWIPYKFGRDASIEGSGGGGSVLPGTIDYIPVYKTVSSVGNSNMYIDGSDLHVDGSIYQNNKLLEIYDPLLSDSLAVPEDVGGITAGTTVGDLRGKTYEQLFNDLIFPTVLAYVGVLNSLGLSGVTTSTLEVGTAVAPSSTATYNPGSITNGDETTGPDLTGDSIDFTFRLPDGTVNGSYSSILNSQAHTFSSYNITFGANTWQATVNYSIGTGAYYDNKGNVVTNLDAQRVTDSRNANSNTITGRRYAWRGYGGQLSAPTDSAGVRVLSSKSFLSATNTGTFDISIPAGTQEVYFFIPAGKTVEVIYLPLVDVTGDFVTESITVNDAAGNPQSYEKRVQFIGDWGYSDDATYRVTIS